MPSPFKQGRQACRKAPNNKLLVRISRQHSDQCTWCPPNGGENCRGHRSAWGKKRAMKHRYATGKGRRQWFNFANRSSYPRYTPQYYDRGIAEGIYTSRE